MAPALLFSFSKAKELFKTKKLRKILGKIRDKVIGNAKRYIKLNFTLLLFTDYCYRHEIKNSE
jgi:hypothetical protein